MIYLHKTNVATVGDVYNRKEALIATSSNVCFMKVN